MRSLIAGWTPRIVALAAALLLTACVVTATGIYFTADDFSVPKAVTGDWTLDPSQGTEKTEESLRVRMSPVAGGLYRAQPLTVTGSPNPNEAPVDFGLVALGGTKFVLVNVEDDGDGKKSNFLGLDAEEDELTFYLFDGGDSDAGKAAFNLALADCGLLVDSSKQYELRLDGIVTREKIKALFEKLLADPAKYDAAVTVYVKK